VAWKRPRLGGSKNIQKPLGFTSDDNWILMILGDFETQMVCSDFAFFFVLAD
jgi:hypothetical protein